jgi:signal transduction histidine kinase
VTAGTSLRLRVTVASLAVVAPVLIVLVIAVTTVFALSTNRSVAAILTDHVQLAQQLAAQHTHPPVLVKRLETHSTRVRLSLADGEVLGSLPNRPVPDNARSRTITFGAATGPLAGAHLKLEVDDRLLAGARRQLTWVLVLVGVGAVALIAVGVPIAMKFALAPLDAMTRVARRIAKGDRGQRTGPADTGTELGRTAAAFNDMLDALEGAEQRAVAAEDSLRRFVADAAHELRTPIAGIGAAAAAALQQPREADPARHDQMLLLLGQEARRAGRLVDELLDLARLDAGLRLELAPAGLRPIVQAQVDRVALLRPDLAFEIVGPDVRTTVDAARIAQVMANLVDNAAHATPNGGMVTVTIAASHDQASITVCDTGPGVAPADRERIFERLVRLDDARYNTHGGAGLGLPIARGIALAHGGELACVEPEYGTAGARFLLRLPL